MATIQDVIQALQRGNKAEARKTLLPLIKSAPRDERVWYLMSMVVDDPQQKRDCLERVLQINPNNADAQKQLASLQAPPVAPSPPAPPPSPELPASDDFELDDDDSAPTATAAFDTAEAEEEPFADDADADVADDTWVARGEKMQQFPWEQSAPIEKPATDDTPAEWRMPHPDQLDALASTADDDAADDSDEPPIDFLAEADAEEEPTPRFPWQTSTLKPPPGMAFDWEDDPQDSDAGVLPWQSSDERREPTTSDLKWTEDTDDESDELPGFSWAPEEDSLPSQPGEALRWDEPEPSKPDSFLWGTAAPEEEVSDEEPDDMFDSGILTPPPPPSSAFNWDSNETLDPNTGELDFLGDLSEEEKAAASDETEASSADPLAWAPSETDDGISFEFADDSPDDPTTPAEPSVSAFSWDDGGEDNGEFDFLRQASEQGAIPDMTDILGDESDDEFDAEEADLETPAEPTFNWDTPETAADDPLAFLDDDEADDDQPGDEFDVEDADLETAEPTFNWDTPETATDDPLAFLDDDEADDDQPGDEFDVEDADLETAEPIFNWDTPETSTADPLAFLADDEEADEDQPADEFDAEDADLDEPAPTPFSWEIAETPTTENADFGTPEEEPAKLEANLDWASADDTPTDDPFANLGDSPAEDPFAELESSAPEDAEPISWDTPTPTPNEGDISWGELGLEVDPFDPAKAVDTRFIPSPGTDDGIDWQQLEGETPDWLPDDSAAPAASNTPAFFTPANSGFDALRASASEDTPAGQLEIPSWASDDLPDLDAELPPFELPDDDGIPNLSTLDDADQAEEEDKPRGLARIFPFLRKKKSAEDEITAAEDAESADSAAAEADIRSRLAMVGGDATLETAAVDIDELEQSRRERAERRQKRKQSRRLRVLFIPLLLFLIVGTCGGLTYAIYTGLVALPQPFGDMAVAYGILPVPTIDPSLPTPTITPTPEPTPTPTATATLMPLPTLPPTSTPTLPPSPTPQATSFVPTGLTVNADLLGSGQIGYIVNGRLFAFALDPTLIEQPTNGSNASPQVGQSIDFVVNSADFSPNLGLWVISATTGDGISNLYTIDPTFLGPIPTPVATPEGSSPQPEDEEDAEVEQLPVPEALFDSTNIGNRFDPVWSPDGSLVAYTVQETGGFRHIWVANSDGTGERPLTLGLFDNLEPTWSPDSSQLVFSSDREGSFDLYIVNVEIGETPDTPAERITSDDRADERQPRFSPDGRVILFVSDESGSPNIYALAVDTLAVVQITRGRATNQNPIFTPDGNFMVFVSTRDGNSEVYISPLDGQAPTRLTASGLINEILPVWLP